MTADSFAGIDIALFSAGGGISKTFAPAAVEAGARQVQGTLNGLGERCGDLAPGVGGLDHVPAGEVVEAKLGAVALGPDQDAIVQEDVLELLVHPVGPVDLGRRAVDEIVEAIETAQQSGLAAARGSRDNQCPGSFVQHLLQHLPGCIEVLVHVQYRGLPHQLPHRLLHLSGLAGVLKTA